MSKLGQRSVTCANYIAFKSRFYEDYTNEVNMTRS